ncbi:hypothetical protein [Bradyrhizobium sp. Cp5.3]|uniref:hypothetical protein n=1 Tax=Bradyrhizobium sp. Cp5.3 TaxID=443598 RepID=UPI00041D6E70|nr:hypothetical protein [Bradyrhizobium sp. Cp5.3]
MIIRVDEGKGGKDSNAVISPSLLEQTIDVRVIQVALGRAKRTLRSNRLRGQVMSPAKHIALRLKQSWPHG